MTYCEREGIPFTTFKDWTDIISVTKEIFTGSKSVKKVAEEGLTRVRTNSIETEKAPRARRASSFDQAAADQELKRLRGGVAVDDVIQE